MPPDRGGPGASSSSAAASGRPPPPPSRGLNIATTTISPPASRDSFDAWAASARTLDAARARRDALRDRADARVLASSATSSARRLAEASASFARANRVARDLARIASRESRDADDAASALERRRLRLREASDALRDARQRVRDADHLLRGAFGRGRLHAQQRALTRERWARVGDVADAFDVDLHHSPAAADDDYAAATATARMNPPSIAGVPLDLAHADDDARPEGGGNGGGDDGEFSSNSSSPFSLFGGGGGGGGASFAFPRDPVKASAALGHATSAVLQLARILDVPLRYPVAPGACQSYVSELRLVARPRFEPSAAEGKDAAKDAPAPPGDSTLNPSSATSGLGANPSVSWRRAEYPLFVDADDASRKKFTRAVELLCEDVRQLLRAHGLRAAGDGRGRRKCPNPLANIRRVYDARRLRCESAPAEAGAATMAVTEGSGVKDAREGGAGAGAGAGAGSGGDVQSGSSPPTDDVDLAWVDS